MVERLLQLSDADLDQLITTCEEEVRSLARRIVQQAAEKIADSTTSLSAALITQLEPELLENTSASAGVQCLSNISDVSAASSQQQAAAAAAAADQQLLPASRKYVLTTANGREFILDKAVKSRHSIRLLFEPPALQYMNWQRQPQGLDRLTCLSKEQGLTLTTPDGRQYLLDDVIIDSGANILLLTEEFCKEIGLHYTVSADVPSMRGISGKLAKLLVGRTGAFELTLAMGTAHATRISVSSAYVIEGNAGGMYKMCLDKQTLHCIFGHVNPAWQHLVWYPYAAEGDRSLLAGIPITSMLMHEDSSDPMAPMAALDLDYFPSFACAAVLEPSCEASVLPSSEPSVVVQELPSEPTAEPCTTPAPIAEPGAEQSTAGSIPSPPTLASLEDCCSGELPASCQVWPADQQPVAAGRSTAWASQQCFRRLP